jgi:cytochrome c oxidase subunit 3
MTDSHSEHEEPVPGSGGDPTESSAPGSNLQAHGGAAEVAASPSENPLKGVGLLGTWLLIGSLGMLFAATMVGYVVIRSRADVWPPPGDVGLPRGMWISTLLILLSSGTMHFAVRSARRDRNGGVIAGLMITTLLGVCFLVSQVLNWLWLIGVQAPEQPALYRFTFYLLTGLHAAHILGAFVMLAIVTIKAFGGRYTSTQHEGLRSAAIFWHFLDVVWCVMFFALYIA